MSVYFLVQLEINDPEEYAECGRGFRELLPDIAHARFLLVEDDPDVIEGEWDDTRTILSEWPSREEAMAFYESDACQRLCELRWTACETNWVMLQALPSPSDC